MTVCLTLIMYLSFIDALRINYQSKSDTRKKMARIGDNFNDVMARKSRKDYVSKFR